MKLEIMNFESKRVEVDLGDKDNIAVIKIEIVTGDEIANVIYKDYSQKCFDSAWFLNDFRILNVEDGEYEVYNCNKEDNLVDNPKWKSRTSSYWDGVERSDDDEM